MSKMTDEKVLLNPQKLNRYSYSLNNPYRLDPDGRTVWDIIDFGVFGYDIYRFIKKPSWSGLGDIGADALGLLPGVPTVGSIKIVGKWLGKVEEISEIAKATKWGRPETLLGHFQRHGKDFGAKSPEEYASMASDFLTRAQKEKLPTKIAADGTIRVYDPKTNTFGAYNPDGTTATFFKPSQGQKYWERQPGKEPWTP